MTEAYAGRTQAAAPGPNAPGSTEPGPTELRNMGVCAFEGERAQAADVLAGHVARHLRRPIARVRLGSVALWLESLRRLFLSPSLAGNRAMRQLEMLSLGRKHQVYLVECHGQAFLIAATGEAVSAPVAVAMDVSAAVTAGSGAR